MPARKRHRRQPEHPDPVVRFGRALEQAKARERSEQLRLQAEREEEKRRARLAAEHAERLSGAKRRLDRAIAAVKQARSLDAEARRAADDEYRAAKALVVELETGERPDWAPEEAG
ncbi:MAG: hypothetical protein HKN41_13460 [Ilumatobacter sp.]|nr:hypothetical protein [Ilumatobacter sp.]